MAKRNEIAQILPVEFVGMAHTVGGVLDVGGVKVRLGRSDIGVYVRRLSTDLRVVEVLMATHDGLAQELLDQQNMEAERYPLGPKEYWRSEMVGKYRYGADQHVMTDADFEADWEED